MSTRQYGTFVVIGSGSGIGNHVAYTFAVKGFSHIIPLARNESDIFIDEIKVDISCRGVARSTEKLEKVGHIIECGLLESVETIEENFETTNIALYIVAQWAIPRLRALSASSAAAKSSLLVTNSLLYANPIPQLFSLSLVKAAQCSLVMSLAKTFNSSGIHIALVTVGGKDAWSWETEILE
ncbi:putative NADP(+)-dependent dehydrogenase [Cenococcum geophilum]